MQYKFIINLLTHRSQVLAGQILPRNHQWLWLIQKLSKKFKTIKNKYLEVLVVMLDPYGDQTCNGNSEILFTTFTYILKNFEHVNE